MSPLKPIMVAIGTYMSIQRSACIGLRHQYAFPSQAHHGDSIEQPVTLGVEAEGSAPAETYVCVVRCLGGLELQQPSLFRQPCIAVRPQDVILFSPRYDRPTTHMVNTPYDVPAQAQSNPFVFFYPCQMAKGSF